MRREKLAIHNRSGSTALFRSLSDTGPHEINPMEVYEGGKHLKLEGIFFYILLALAQVLFIVLYGIWLDYPSPSNEEENHRNITLYPFFRDVSIMIFFGFGYLMTFLRRYGYSAIG